MSRMAQAESTANTGDVILSGEIVDMLGEGVQIVEWREADGQRFAKIAALTLTAERRPWPALDDANIAAETLRTFLQICCHSRSYQHANVSQSACLPT